MFWSRFAILLLYVLSLISVASAALGHTSSLGWRDAEVHGHWSGYIIKCAGCAWDRNFGSYAWEVGMNNGYGDTITVNYTWPRDKIKGDYFKVNKLVVFARENSHCYPAVDYVYTYNPGTKKWDYAFRTSCGGTKTFTRTFSSDEHFDYKTNSVIVQLRAYRSNKQRLYELGVSKVDYWYNWFPRARFGMPGKAYMNTSINWKNFTVYDPDEDKITYTYIWEINNKIVNETELSKVKLNIGDKLVLRVHACDPYNCTNITHTTRIVNFAPKLTISTDEFVQGGKTLRVNYTVIDLPIEKQTHNITCSLGNATVNKSVSIGDGILSIKTPTTEGNYTLNCSVCDGINCTTTKRSIVVDNTPPEFISISIPRCTNLKNIEWKTTEPSHLEFSTSLNFSRTNLTDGNQTLCVRPVDRAGNIGETVCKGVVIDRLPTSISAPKDILPLGQNFTVNASDPCGVAGWVWLANKPSERCMLNSTCNLNLSRGNNTIIVNATDNAGNQFLGNVTIRVNTPPSVVVRIPRVYADSKEICEVQVINEPDQGYNLTKTLLVNGMPFNGTLKRRDRLTCIANATDALGETGSGIAKDIVLNKPPDLQVDWTPRFPSVGESVKVHLTAHDVDGDNVTTIAKSANKTFGNKTFAITASAPGNYTINISAFDGMNWTNTSFVIPYHLCGDNVVEPGEDCDGAAKKGYRCVNCRLVRLRVKHRSGGSSGGWGGGGPTVSTAPVVYKPQNKTKASNKTAQSNESRLSENKVEKVNATVKTNKHSADERNIELPAEYNVSLLTEGIYAEGMYASPKQIRRESPENALTELDKGINITTAKSPVTAMVALNQTAVSVLASLAIVLLGLKYRGNLRRLSIRLKAMTAKVRPRKSYPIRDKKLF